MSKLIDVISKVDFDLLHEQNEALVLVEQEVRAEIEQATRKLADMRLFLRVSKSDIDNQQKTIDHLNSRRDSLNGVIEFNDALMNAAADDGEWEDPTRPDNLNLDI
jgi:hypothetical protein